MPLVMPLSLYSSVFLLSSTSPHPAWVCISATKCFSSLPETIVTSHGPITFWSATVSRVHVLEWNLEISQPVANTNHDVSKLYSEALILGAKQAVKLAPPAVQLTALLRTGAIHGFADQIPKESPKSII
ncbi:hypothetical protein K440DRAFT_634704 [Wilcoxina mikolae CBS 423.85]|nr:hypothetical protein K440DRAFT_634704 [Wilcoxina mikolae CBS 423.85]